MTTIVTASQLYSFLSCPPRVVMDAVGDPALRDAVSPFMQLLWERGTAHEKSLMAGVGAHFIDLSGLHGDAKERATREAIARGEPLIYGGRLSVSRVAWRAGHPAARAGRLRGHRHQVGRGKGGSEEEGEAGCARTYGVQLALYTGHPRTDGPFRWPPRIHLGWARPRSALRPRRSTGAALALPVGGLPQGAAAAARALLHPRHPADRRCAATASSACGAACLPPVPAERAAISPCCPSLVGRHVMRWPTKFQTLDALADSGRGVLHRRASARSSPASARRRCAASTVARNWPSRRTPTLTSRAPSNAAMRRSGSVLRHRNRSHARPVLPARLRHPRARSQWCDPRNASTASSPAAASTRGRARCLCRGHGSCSAATRGAGRPLFASYERTEYRKLGRRNTRMSRRSEEIEALFAAATRAGPVLRRGASRQRVAHARFLHQEPREALRLPAGATPTLPVPRPSNGSIGGRGPATRGCASACSTTTRMTAAPCAWCWTR